MARPTRSEWQVNQLMAATPRAPARPYRKPPRQLPLLRVLRWIGGAVVVAASLSWMGVV